MSTSSDKTTGLFLLAVVVTIFAALIVAVASRSEVAGWCVGLSPLVLCVARWLKKRDDGIWLGLSTVVAVLPYALLVWRIVYPRQGGGGP